MWLEVIERFTGKSFFFFGGGGERRELGFMRKD